MEGSLQHKSCRLDSSVELLRTFVLSSLRVVLGICTHLRLMVPRGSSYTRQVGVYVAGTPASWSVIDGFRTSCVTH